MDCLTLKMGPISCLETSATNCYSTLRKMQEERISQAILYLRIILLPKF